MESRDRDSLITDSVVQEMSEWYDRALDCVYPVSFVDVHPVVRFISQHTLRPRSSTALGLTETEQKPVAQRHVVVRASDVCLTSRDDGDGTVLTSAASRHNPSDDRLTRQAKLPREW
jgi:hypothetical protein